MKKTSLAFFMCSLLFFSLGLAFWTTSTPWQFAPQLELHMTVEHWRNGILVSTTYHPMTLTNYGKNWIADKLSGASDTNFLDNATWIAVSNDASAVDPGWTALPNEITDGGLARAEGSVVDTGTGTWNVTYTFSVTATRSTKLYGLHLTQSGNDLVAAEQQGVGSQKNFNDGDTLKVTVQGSIA